MPYHQLSSEKYWQASAEREIAQIRYQRNRDAVRSLAQSLLAAGVFSLTIVAVLQMPNWMPSLTAMVDQSGVVEMIQRWF